MRFGLSLLLLFFIPLFSIAASKPTAGTAVARDQIFEMKLENGRTISCLDKRGSAAPGTVKERKGKLLFYSMEASIKASIAKLKKKKGKKARAKIAALKAQLATAKGVCRKGGSLTPHGESLTRDEALHLYRRAGFGGTPAEIQSAISLGLSATLEKLLRPVPTPELDAESVGLLDGDPEPASPPTVVTDEGLRLVYLNYALKSPNQLQEKMAYFWHDRFAASTRVLGGSNMHFALGYLNTIRNNALGDYRTIAQELTTNGMMLYWLDGRHNRVGRVNENYAREFWELYTLGKGNYTERDIAEAARAFTGWTTQWDDTAKRHEVVYMPSWVDGGTKMIFENTPWKQVGNFTARDLVNVTLDHHPEAPRHLARALYRFFVGSDPSERHLALLAAELKSANYNVQPVITRILKSKAFFAAASQHNTIKTPIEFALGFLRSSELTYNIEKLDRALSSMGLTFLQPGSVKGWDDNEYWLNDQWMIARANFPHHVVNEATSRNAEFQLAFLAPPPPATSDTFLRALEARFDVMLSVEERANVDHYLNVVRRWNGTNEPWLFDPRHKENFEAKARGSLFILAQHDSYQMN